MFQRTTLRKEVHDKVAARWKELGLSGTIPGIRAIEQAAKVPCHEVGGS